MLSACGVFAYTSMMYCNDEIRCLGSDEGPSTCASSDIWVSLSRSYFLSLITVLSTIIFAMMMLFSRKSIEYIKYSSSGRVSLCDVSKKGITLVVIVISIPSHR